jgi:hypothetical protein
MPVSSALFEHANFGGVAVTTTSGPFRYAWTRYGTPLNDLFSSMRAVAAGHRGNVYAFEHIDFNGRFAALNVGGRFSSAWWSYFGDDFNDQVSSSLIVARAPAEKEREISLGWQIVERFAGIFDDKTAGKPVSRVGEPRLYCTMFPSYDRERVLLTIDQELKVQVRIPIKVAVPVWTPWGGFDTVDLDSGEQLRWSDYRANVRYDVAFWVDGDGSPRAAVRWFWVWVEGGPFSQTVYDELEPQMRDAAKDVTDALQGGLSLFRVFERGRFSDAYLLPGPAPDMNAAGFKARYDDDVTLVLVRA